MSGRSARDLRLIEGDGTRSSLGTQVRAKPVEVDRAAADLGRRLALWLADVAAEADRTPAVEATESADRGGLR